MIGYFVRRTLLAALTIVIISFVTFGIIQLPKGDFVDYYVQTPWVLKYVGDLSEEEMDAMREEIGLNRPLVVQYWDWADDILLRADFGYAFITGALKTPIRDLMMDRLPATFALAAFTIVITWTLAIPIGIYSAVRQHSIGDYAFTFFGFTGLAVPDFLLGLVLMYLTFDLFGMSVGGLYSGEYREAAWDLDRIWDLLKHLVIPGIVLGTAGTAALIRIMRNNLLDELGKPYVVTARAKGLPAWRAIIKYPVRVAINPLISSIGTILPALIGGTVIVSMVLSLPTLGPLLLIALQEQDMYLAGSIILLLAVLTVIGTLLSDLLLVVVDPRIRLTGSAR